MDKPKVWNKYHNDAPADAVYVGRPSKWGNPHPIGGGKTREEVIRLYRQWVAHRRNEIRQELRGKHLICFCAPKPCHADVLLEIANGTETELG
jgi:hypothetical protein